MLLYLVTELTVVLRYCMLSKQTRNGIDGKFICICVIGVIFTAGCEKADHTERSHGLAAVVDGGAQDASPTCRHYCQESYDQNASSDGDAGAQDVGASDAGDILPACPEPAADAGQNADDAGGDADLEGDAPTLLSRTAEQCVLQ